MAEKLAFLVCMAIWDAHTNCNCSRGLAIQRNVFGYRFGYRQKFG